MASVALGRIAREKIVEDVKALLEEKGGAVVITYVGISANDLNQFRRKLREQGARMLVVKNTLAKLSAEQAGMPELGQFCQAQSALVFPCEDTIAFTKLVVDFATQNKDVVQIFGGVIEGRVLTADDIVAMSKLPSKDYLYAQVVGAVSAPLSGLVGALSGVLRKLVYVLKAIEEKQQGK